MTKILELCMLTQKYNAFRVVEASPVNYEGTKSQLQNIRVVELWLGINCRHVVYQYEAMRFDDRKRVTEPIRARSNLSTSLNLSGIILKIKYYYYFTFILTNSLNI